MAILARSRLDGIPAENMLPEVAYVKLAWALGQMADLGATIRT